MKVVDGLRVFGRVWCLNQDRFILLKGSSDALVPIFSFSSFPLFLLSVSRGNEPDQVDLQLLGQLIYIGLIQ
jgi:hypothetical protein